MSMKRGSPFIMKQMSARDGHLYVFMYDANRQMKKVWVHRAVLSAFCGYEEKTLDYVTQFATFNRFTNSPMAYYKGEVYSMPFNMHTFKV